MHIAVGLAAALLGAVLWPAPAAAQRATYAPGAAAEARPLPPAQRLERRFLQITAANLRLRGEASQLVLARSDSTAVKELAQTLLARQQAAQPELLRMLHARDMALPLPGNDHARMLKELAKLKGARLDRLYVEEVVLRTYQADIANAEKLAQQGEDPVLKAWIERQLPTLRFHLAKAGRALPSASLRGRPAA
jgi:putative membrane protein